MSKTANICNVIIYLYLGILSCSSKKISTKNIINDIMLVYIYIILI